MWRQAIKETIKGNGLALILSSVIWIVIFLNVATIHQHFINNWIYVGGCFVLSFPVSALLTILIVMLKMKLRKSDESKKEN